MDKNYWEKVNEEIYQNGGYSEYDEVHNFVLKNILKKGEKLKILDVGCGDGRLLNKIKNQELFGVDVNLKELEKAEQRGVVTSRLNIDIEPLPYKDDFFDVIISSEVVEHLLVPDNLIKEAYRVLKNDGIFIVTTPNVASLGRRIMLFLGKNVFFESSPYDKDAVGHLRYFTADSLKKLFRKYGFKITKLSSDLINFDSHGFLKSKKLAKFFPRLGRTLICVFKK